MARMSGSEVRQHVVDHHPTSLSHLQPGRPGQLVPGPDAGREHHHVAGQKAAVRELQAGGPPVLQANGLGDLAGMNPHPQRLDLTAQDGPPRLVHLQGHQPGRQLHHVGLEPEVPQRVGRLQSQQAAAHHRSHAGPLRPLLDRLQILDRPIDEATLAVPARHRRNERPAPRGQHQPVVHQHPAAGGVHLLGRPIDGHHRIAQMHRKPGGRIFVGRGHRQLGRGLALEELRQVHPVVSQPGLLDQDRHHQVTSGAGLGEAAQQVMAHHAVADHHHVQLWRHRPLEMYGGDCFHLVASR